jgi:hypothetical protein
VNERIESGAIATLEAQRDTVRRRVVREHAVERRGDALAFLFRPIHERRLCADEHFSRPADHPRERLVHVLLPPFTVDRRDADRESIGKPRHHRCARAGSHREKFGPSIECHQVVTAADPRKDTATPAV